MGGVNGGRLDRTANKRKGGRLGRTAKGMNTKVVDTEVTMLWVVEKIRPVKTVICGIRAPQSGVPRKAPRIGGKLRREAYNDAEASRHGAHNLLGIRPRTNMYVG